MRRKEVWYVAHPVSGDARNNAMKAVAWIRWLTLNDPGRVYVAPWVAEVLAFADTPLTPEFYERVLSDDLEVVCRLDGVLMVGGRVSAGMARERDAADNQGRDVIDWTKYETPDQVPQGVHP